MISIGVDIGTTTISGVALDIGEKRVLRAVTIPNGFEISGSNPLHRMQDGERIARQAADLVGELSREYGGECIGVTGQMHGILYVNGQGKAVTPLYTWQDSCGEAQFQQGMTFCQWMEEKTGYLLASGFGSVTHFYLQQTGAQKPEAAYLCTIGDYVAMRLTGAVQPVIHRSNGASLGLYDFHRDSFDEKALDALGLDPGMFPEIGSCTMGETAGGIPVAVAIGDNQASFLGSVQDPRRQVLMNIGTGGQISCWAKTAVPGDLYEIRPYLDDGFLLVASSLCGGRAYAALEGFFRQVLQMAGASCESLYAAMEQAARALPNGGSPLTVDTRFCGTREHPERRGSIQGIGLDNLTPGHFIDGVLRGMAGELLPAYRAFCRTRTFSELTASGNGVRQNRYFQQVLQQEFGLPLTIAPFEEEAACGAALYAAGIR